MSRKSFLRTAIVTFLLACAIPALPQETAVKGSVAGTIYDTSGAVVPGAKVTLTGPTLTTSADSDRAGNFTFSLVIPGIYAVKAEKAGFKVAEVKNVEVATNRASSVDLTLEPGSATQVVEVSAAAIRVDTASTATGANLTDNFYEKIPAARGVSGLFYLSPGVASGGKSGPGNPSISGGSGLENLYVADGVNITDEAFGGLGTFSRSYGSLATGINLSFVKEVDVKTGGYEPQYGKATGGIVQIVTKSGGSEFHGTLGGYFAPQQLEAERLHPDDFGRINLYGKQLHQGNWDLDGEIGGYVPGQKEKLFFFASVNPSWEREYNQAPAKFGLSKLGIIDLQTNAYNYAGKLTYRINDKHTVEASDFGDPSHSKTGPQITGALVSDNQSQFSRLKFGTRSMVARYNGVLSPTWLVTTDVTWGHNTLVESNFANINEITDRTQQSGLPGQRGRFIAQGLGYYENTTSNSYGFDIGTTKDFHFAGNHTVSIGYRLERPRFYGLKDRSGPKFPIPATNADGVSTTTMGVPAADVGLITNVDWYLRLAPASCTLCPLLNVPGRGMVPVDLQQPRGEFEPPNFKTKATYHAVYADDSWRLNKYVTINAGYRWEIQRLGGHDISYSFTDNWLPRMGITIDPWGDRKTKAYFNFGRYDYVLPLDVGERTLTNEQDFILARFAPAFTIDPVSGKRIATVDQYGTVIPVPDAAHLITRAVGGIAGSLAVSSQGNLEGFAPGTKMEYEDEYVVGFEREFRGGIVFSARYLDRRFKRIIEDTGGIPPEAYNAGVPQVYEIANVAANTDIFTNPIEHTFTPGAEGTSGFPSQCDPTLVADPVVDTFNNTLGAACFETNGKNGKPAGTNVPDGVLDGFPDPVRNYNAVELEVNKSFSHNWQMRANWRIAKLYGNFEGAFRNDNGQTDPGISSLFDFTSGLFGLLGDQFKPGVLNTDRTHIVNIYSSYVFDRSRVKGMTLGGGMRFETGIPINDLKAHPAYLNAGEIPVNGRGFLGRTPSDGSLDLHLDYPMRLTEHLRLRFGVDLFNVLNRKTQLRVDEYEDSSFGVANLDFKKPGGQQADGPRPLLTFERPFYARGMVKLEF